ncbi:MAG: diguanylate cyclase [Pseudobacteriovorax sp.]|nr:diguanylate cyclase [Pseudobacteriovorax sp.]
MRVLIVESSNTNKHLSSVFSPHTKYSAENGFGITCVFKSASSFAEAINHFQDMHPDLIVIELGANLTEACEFAKLIRVEEDQRHTGIIFLQGNQAMSEQLPAICLEAGGDEFIESKASDREVYARVSSAYRYKIMTDKLRSANHRLKELSLTDELTGLHNMRSFNKKYRQILKSAQELQKGFGIIMLDLDHFKSINDTTNHLMGSFVIGEVGRLIKEEVASIQDSVPARYGGDEYVICLPSDDPQEVMAVGQSICNRIRLHGFNHDGFLVSVTASIGLSWVPMGFKGLADDPLKGADLMLYKSKDQGRNCVNGMMLRDSIDLNHVSGLHLIDGNPSGNHNNVVAINNLKVF